MVRYVIKLEYFEIERMCQFHTSVGNGHRIVPLVVWQDPKRQSVRSKEVRILLNVDRHS